MYQDDTAFAECSQNQLKFQKLDSRSVRLFSFHGQIKTTLYTTRCSTSNENHSVQSEM